MSTKAYHIPDIVSMFTDISWKEMINPRFHEVEASFNAQIEKKFGADLAMKVKKTDSPFVVALCYPYASSDQLRGLIYWSVAAFLVDDMVDHCPKEDAPALAESWLNLLRSADVTDMNFSNADVERQPIELLFRELLPAIKELVDPIVWPQFIHATEKTIAEMAAEAHFRELYMKKNITPDVESLLASRRLSVGAGPYFTYLRSVHSLYIPEHVLADPAVQEMEVGVRDYLIISNDLYSYKKEYAFDKAFGNILTSIQLEPDLAHLDFQGVLDHASQMAIDALKRTKAASKNLPSFGAEIDRFLVLYVDGLMDIAIGNLYWSLFCTRYDVFENEEDREKSILRLAL